LTAAATRGFLSGRFAFEVAYGFGFGKCLGRAGRAVRPIQLVPRFGIPGSFFESLGFFTWFAWPGRGFGPTGSAASATPAASAVAAAGIEPRIVAQARIAGLIDFRRAGFGRFEFRVGEFGQ